MGRGLSSAWFVSAATAGLLLIAASGAVADDKLTEANMTQRDYDRITNTTNSRPDDPAAGPKVEVEPIHDLNRAQEGALKDEGHATKVIKGKEWTDKSPEDRDAHLRRIRETAPEGSRFLIEVPNGDVWLLPPPETTELGLHIYLHLVRRWQDFEKVALPVAVAPETGSSHSDRSGTKVARTVKTEERL